MSLEFNDFPNYGYLLHNVPEDLFEKLKEIINEEKLERFNSNLAGNIKKEFLIPKANSLFENYIITLCSEYEKKFNYLESINYCNKDVPLTLNKMWVNFQEKYEFNPMHTHNGVFSFVIWLQVPFTLEEEKKTSPGKESNFDLTGCFQFQYTNSLGEIKSKNIYVDKTWEGKICLFPAHLNHSVSPFFSSDNYRISVSGNISLAI